MMKLKQQINFMCKNFKTNLNNIWKYILMIRNQNG